MVADVTRVVVDDAVIYKQQRCEHKMTQ